MENENLNNVSGEDVAEDQDYIQAINDLKSNTVSKEQYQKLRDENKKLLDALVTGQQVELPKEEKVDIDALRKRIFDPDADISNIEYIDSALKLRSAILDQGGEDIFLPSGDKVEITDDMRDKAARVAEGLRSCVDFAEGDSAIFTAQLQRITKDTLPQRRR